MSDPSQLVNISTICVFWVAHVPRVGERVLAVANFLHLAFATSSIERLDVERLSFDI
jgi:hypothetical protein